MDIIPLTGRKKRLKLTRTEYRIELVPWGRAEQKGHQISIPALKDEEGTYRLYLRPANGQKITEFNSCYWLEAVGSGPFRLNGVLTYHAQIEPGDWAQIAGNRFCFQVVKGCSDRDLASLSTNVIESNLNILLEGETGTGKSSLAKKIHQQSGRMGQFIQLNLASFSENLIESEIFGHVKGSFTSAVNEKMGAIKEAHRGTLFLDEIDSIPKSIQTKLLLFFDNFQVRPVGGHSSQRVDTRVIFASGRDLQKAVEAGSIRPDFYFRIMSGAYMKLSALRHDPQKIEEICLQFAGQKEIGISHQLIKFYQTQSWPGNIRQLVGHLEKKWTCQQGKKMIYDQFDEQLGFSLSIPIIKKVAKEKGPISLSLLKNSYVHIQYQNQGQNLKRTAKILEISENTVRKIVNQQ